MQPDPSRSRGTYWFGGRCPPKLPPSGKFKGFNYLNNEYNRFQLYNYCIISSNYKDLKKVPLNK